jgi:alpha-galactosidase
MKGRALAAIKKERKKKEKLSKGKWVKKKGGGDRKRSSLSSSTLFFYTAHNRRDRSLVPHLVSQKERKRKILKEKEIARRTKTQKIRNKIRTITKNCYRSDRPFAGEVTSRPITQTRTKKTFCLKRRARFPKTKKFL